MFDATLCLVQVAGIGVVAIGLLFIVVSEDEDFSADDARYLCECLNTDAPDAQRARLACCSSYNTNHTNRGGDCAGDLVIPEFERVENSLYSADIDIKTGLDWYGTSDGVVHTEDWMDCE